MPTRTPEKFQPRLHPALAEPAHPAPGARANASGDHAVAHAPHERLLFGAARQSGVGDPDSCQTIMAILTASRAIRRRLDRELGTEELTESRFATLITLYAMAPLAATPGDLAYHAEVSRAAMTDVVDALDKHGWIVRERRGDRRLKPVRISAQGRSVAVRAVHRFLELASVIAGDLCLADRRAAVAICTQVEHHAARLDPARGA
jgi:DNA-binding MarR family transcriptional regulator